MLTYPVVPQKQEYATVRHSICENTVMKEETADAIFQCSSVNVGIIE